MPRCNSSTGGSAISTSTGLSPVIRATSTPAHTSVISSCPWSTTKTSAQRASGSAVLTASPTSPALRTLASTATATSANVSGAGCSTSRPQSVHRPGRAWNSTEPPAWDSPIAAAEYTRLYEEIRRTRHWVSAINGTGASSAYTGGRSTAIGTNQAPSMSLAFIPAGSGTRRVASTDAAGARAGRDERQRHAWRLVGADRGASAAGVRTAGARPVDGAHPVAGTPDPYLQADLLSGGNRVGTRRRVGAVPRPARAVDRLGPTCPAPGAADVGAGGGRRTGQGPQRRAGRAGRQDRRPGGALGRRLRGGPRTA